MALPRRLRLPGPRVRKVLEDGVRASAGPLLLRALPRPEGDAGGGRVAIRVAGARRAVDRNAVRRRIADAIARAPAGLPPLDVVLSWRLGPRPPAPAEIAKRWTEALDRLRGA